MWGEFIVDENILSTWPLLHFWAANRSDFMLPYFYMRTLNLSLVPFAITHQAVKALVLEEKGLYTPIFIK